MISTFYIQTSICVAVWWILVSSVTRRPLFHVMEGSVVTIPSWLPKSAVLLLQRYRPWIFYGETVGLALASSFPHIKAIRILAALLYTLYHLTESSESNRHGEYPVLFGMWAMCMEQDEYRHACVWGIAIHFILSSGYSKIVVGGFSEWGALPRWIEPLTMQTYLSHYQTGTQKLNRPVFPSLSRAVSNSKVLCFVISIAILFLECVATPTTLFLDAQYRPYACYGIIGMHIGIACIMSLKVGFVFITSLPIYAYGFDCTTNIGSIPWHVASIIGLGPTLFSLLVMPIPENWPLCPVSLFMWNGETARCLKQLLMTGDTRIVLGTATTVANNGDLVGLKVIHHGEEQLDGQVNTNDVEGDGVAMVLHDCILRDIGFTMVQGSGFLVQAARALEQEKGFDLDGSDSTKSLLHQICAWLAIEARLVEVKTGEDLTHAYLIREDGSKRISEVIL